MSINLNVYVGWYIECPKSSLGVVDLGNWELFINAYDEGGSNNVNNSHIYIPNIHIEGCHHIDNFADGGVVPLTSIPTTPPPDVMDAMKCMKKWYGEGNVILGYGIIKFWS